MIDETLPWLTFPPAVDLSNTIVVTPRGDVDLLTTEEQLDVWIAAERSRIVCVDAAAGRLDDVRALRADLRALLYAHAQDRPLPGPPRRRVNALSAAAPAYPVIAAGGEVSVEHASDDAFAILTAELARSAIEVFAGDGRRLSVCTAPSCGLLFPPEHARQRWCCRACGNRARVARHAARQRSATRA
ncbi:MAG: CGNR zinc finger domain-containing protein [Acidimicrobiales bacterium]